MIEQQHSLFGEVRRRISSAQKKRNKRVNDGRVKKTYGVGDPVYYRAQVRKGKLDPRWKPYYRIVKQTGPVTYKIWDQLTNKMMRVHASDICEANIREWEMPNIQTDRPVRKATLKDREGDWEDTDRWADDEIADQRELEVEFKVENTDLLTEITTTPPDSEG